MNTLLKIVGALVSIGAGFAGRKLVDVVWSAITGEAAPKATDKEAQVEATLRHALGFAVLSSVVAAVIQVLTNRGTQQAIARFVDNMDEV